MPALALLVLLVLSAQTVPPVNARAVPPGWIVIDGSKTPDQIPEHVAWYSGFETIVTLVEKGITERGPLTELTLLDADWKLVLEEAGSARERRMTCHVRGGRLTQAMKGADVEKIVEALKEVTLDCRVRLLESKDQLLARMTPEGAAALTAWMLSERLKVKALMPKEEVEFYRLPR